MNGKMKKLNHYEILGIIICILSVVIGAYLGMWWCFIGGIIMVIEGFQFNPLCIDSSAVALGVLRFMASGIVGWVSFMFVYALGLFFIQKGNKRS